MLLFTGLSFARGLARMRNVLVIAETVRKARPERPEKSLVEISN
jgi:hypothetical protein